MVEKTKTENVLAAYIILTMLLALIGYFMGKTKQKKKSYAITGALIGLIVSTMLWLSWGQYHTY